MLEFAATMVTMETNFGSQTTTRTRPRRRSALGLLGASLALSALAFTGTTGVANAAADKDLVVCNKGSGFNVKVFVPGGNASEFVKPGGCSEAIKAAAGDDYKFTFRKEDGQQKDGDGFQVYEEGTRVDITGTYEKYDRTPWRIH